MVGLRPSLPLDLVTMARCEASACVCVPHRLTPSFFVVSPSSWRSSNIPVMSFMSSLSPLDWAFIPSWRRQQGFPGEFYKCPSGGTAGTSLFPSAHKLSFERRQSSAWWESWRSFWSALECDSQCWSGMKHIDRNEGIWAKSETFEQALLCDTLSVLSMYLHYSV